MRLLSPITGKVFNTPVINLLACNGVEVVFVLEPTLLTEGSVIGRLDRQWAGATHSEAISGMAISWHSALAARSLSDSAHRIDGSVHGGSVD
jgi:hypothetical protein